MITFDKASNVVKLTNGKIDYAVYINTEGYLETVYFGKAIRNFDPTTMRTAPKWHAETHVYDPAIGSERWFADGFKQNVAPLEISPHARRDKRGAPVICARENGSFATDFLYVSHRIFDGTEPLDGLPSVHGDNCQTVEFLLKERTRELYVKHRITIFDDCDIVVKNYTIVNKTGLEVTLSRAMSMQLDLPRNNYNLTHFSGRWAAERNAVTNKLVDGVQEVSSKLGAPTEDAIRDYTRNNGCALMLGDLEWSPYYDIRVEGYKTGVHIIEGTRIQHENPIAFMGGFYRLNVIDCLYGLVVDQLYKGWGMLVTHSQIDAEKASVVNNAPEGYVRLTDTETSGNMYGERIFVNAAQASDLETQTPVFAKTKEKLYNVVADYGAEPNGYADCTVAIQKALSDADKNGGGIVYLPAGYYKVTQRLTVGNGVQLRGCMSVANRDNLGKSGGTIIFCYVDSDSNTAETDTAFVTLGADAGLYGLRICYPDNNIWMIGQNEYTVNRTAYTVRAAGNNGYIVNVGLLDSYNGVAVSADNVVVKNLLGLFFNQAVFVDNSNNCHVENVISNATIATQSGLHSKFTDLFGKAWLWRVNALWNYYTYTETHTKMIRARNSTVNVMSVFTFCSAEIFSAKNSVITANGCGADRMWQDGIVLNSIASDVTLVNQLKYNCMMFNVDGVGTLNIFGRMNLVLGNSPATKDVEYNVVDNVVVKDTNAKVYGAGIKVSYPCDDVLGQPSSKNPITDIVGILKGLK